MNEVQQLARSRKYDSSLVWHFAEIKPGLFALYSFDRRDDPIICETWDEVLEHYRARKPYVPARRLMLEPRAEIDLSKLEITI